MGNITINQDSLKTSREWKRHKVQDGSNVYRILPPYGKVEVHNNYPYRKWSIAWLMDPKRGKRMPFATPLTDGEEDCPVKEYQDALKKHIDNKKAMLQAEGMSDDSIRETLKPLHEVQWQIKVQHLYAYNACDKSGNVGLLEIKSTAHRAMKKKMSEYIEKYGQDPTSLNSDLKEDSGVWFNIKKEGSGKSTEYSVEFATISSKDSDGELVFKNDRSELPETVVDGYNQLGYDLNSVYRRKDYNELREILVNTLALLAEDCPEVVLPGFEATNNTTTQTTQQTDRTNEATSTANKAKVNLNLDDDEEVVSTNSVSSDGGGGVEASGDIDDLKDFADSILGD